MVPQAGGRQRERVAGFPYAHMACYKRAHLGARERLLAENLHRHSVGIRYHLGIGVLPHAGCERP